MKYCFYMGYVLIAVNASLMAMSQTPAIAGPLIVSGQTISAQQAAIRGRIDQYLAGAKKLTAQARAREADLNSLPGWRHVVTLEQRIAEIDSLFAGGDWARAYDLAAAWSFIEAGTRVVNEVLEAVPVIVLGPFGDSRVTNPADHKLIPDFKTILEIPYLNEYSSDAAGKTNSEALAGTFRIDGMREYPVYPGRKAKWMPAFKTEYLNLDPWCAESNLWMTAYFYMEIFSPERRDGAFKWTSENLAGVWGWLNGQRAVGGYKTPFYGYARCNMRLEQGWNTMLFKVVLRQDASFSFSIVHGWTHADITPMHDLRFRVPATQAGAIK